jgi:DNA transformation protein and related proteins
MATSQSTMDYLLDQLAQGGGACSARKMFGEYCLYYQGRPVGLVCNEQLYLKNTEPGRALMPHPAEGAPFPGARPHLLLCADDWDDHHWLHQIVRATLDALPPPKPKSAAKPKPTPGPDSQPKAPQKPAAKLR